jgi:hypothetical protein
MIKPNREENLFKMKKQPLKLLYIASTILQWPTTDNTTQQWSLLPTA